jgi:mono/diheme cytochrome c family protein
MHRLPAIFVVGFAAFSSGCHRDMVDQARCEPYEASTFFADGRAMRPQVEGTVARGHLDDDDALISGKKAGRLVTVSPVNVDDRLLHRGQERFGIYCSVCHGLSGDGDGMIVRRGFKRPPTFHSERMRGMPIGHFFDVATHGFGAMPAYANQIPTRDRWAIAVYVRVLQLSRHAPQDQLTATERQHLEGERP